MIIFGIDPGIAVVGYCAMQTEDLECCNLVTWGSIQTEKGQPIARRLFEIHKDLKCLLEEVKPDVVAIEDLYFFKNTKTFVPVLQARGVILMTAEMLDIPVYEYTPLVVKQVLTGYGRASKDEVKDMVCRTLNLSVVPRLDDIIDAAAIAYCHMRHL
jgi:crossover junction endodeoxyribonuclease RuvC